jgi:hypothetical protein
MLLVGDSFYIFRSSSECPNTQFIMEPLHHGVGGKILPRLLDYLSSRPKAVVNFRTIDDVLPIFLYLWKSLPPGPHRPRRLKMYHSLRDAEESEDRCRPQSCPGSDIQESVIEWSHIIPATTERVTRRVKHSGREPRRKSGIRNHRAPTGVHH